MNGMYKFFSVGKFSRTIFSPNGDVNINFINGIITATNFEFWTKFKCDYNLTDFPFDKHYCCEEFTSKGNVLIFSWHDYRRVAYDRVVNPSHWKILNVTAIYSPSDNYIYDHGSFEICITF